MGSLLSKKKREEKRVKREQARVLQARINQHYAVRNALCEGWLRERSYPRIPGKVAKNTGNFSNYYYPQDEKVLHKLLREQERKNRVSEPTTHKQLQDIVKEDQLKQLLRGVVKSGTKLVSSGSRLVSTKSKLAATGSTPVSKPESKNNNQKGTFQEVNPVPRKSKPAKDLSQALSNARSIRVRINSEPEFIEEGFQKHRKGEKHTPSKGILKMEGRPINLWPRNDY